MNPAQTPNSDPPKSPTIRTPRPSPSNPRSPRTFPNPWRPAPKPSRTSLPCRHEPPRARRLPIPRPLQPPHPETQPQCRTPLAAVLHRLQSPPPGSHSDATPPPEAWQRRPDPDAPRPPPPRARGRPVALRPPRRVRPRARPPCLRRLRLVMAVAPATRPLRLRLLPGGHRFRRGGPALRCGEARRARWREGAWGAQSEEAPRCW